MRVDELELGQRAGIVGTRPSGRARNRDAPAPDPRSSRARSPRRTKSFLYVSSFDIPPLLSRLSRLVLGAADVRDSIPSSARRASTSLGQAALQCVDRREHIDRLSEHGRDRISLFAHPVERVAERELLRASRRAFTSLHASGIDTGAPGSGRTLNGATSSCAVAVLQPVEIDLAARGRRSRARWSRSPGAAFSMSVTISSASVRALLVRALAPERDQDVQPGRAAGLDEGRQLDSSHSGGSPAPSPPRRRTARPSDRGRGCTSRARRGRATRLDQTWSGIVPHVHDVGERLDVVADEVVDLALRLARSTASRCASTPAPTPARPSG